MISYGNWLLVGAICDLLVHSDEDQKQDIGKMLFVDVFPIFSFR